MDPYVSLAYDAIVEYLATQTKLKPSGMLPPEMLKKRAGVFVSLHNKKDHALRGCIGTFLPVEQNIAREIISNAISAALDDPRFPPMTQQDADTIEISVDILSAPEQVFDVGTLDPKKYGLLVKNKAGRAGLLLPDIGIDTIENQIALCCHKGAIDPRTDALELFRFTVERHA